MRISDWSSDVCSSDLSVCGTRRAAERPNRAGFRANYPPPLGKPHESIRCVRLRLIRQTYPKALGTGRDSSSETGPRAGSCRTRTSGGPTSEIIFEGADVFRLRIEVVSKLVRVDPVRLSLSKRHHPILEASGSARPPK